MSRATQPEYDLAAPFPPVFPNMQVVAELKPHPLNEREVAVVRVVEIKGYEPRLFVQRMFWRNERWNFGKRIMSANLQVADWLLTGGMVREGFSLLQERVAEREKTRQEDEAVRLEVLKRRRMRENG